VLKLTKQPNKIIIPQEEETRKAVMLRVTLHPSSAPIPLHHFSILEKEIRRAAMLRITLHPSSAPIPLYPWVGEQKKGGKKTK